MRIRLYTHPTPVVNPPLGFPRFIQDNMYEHYLDNLETSDTSVSFDIGSYTGASLIALRAKVKGSIYGFEPIPSYFTAACSRVQTMSNVRVYCVGVGNKDETKQLSLLGDRTSALLTSSQYQPCTFRAFSTIWRTLGIESLDVLHMNVEGGEYDIFQNIVEGNFLPRIKQILVQFHYPESYAPDRERIRSELRKTHNLIYDYEFVWERWDLRV